MAEEFEPGRMPTTQEEIDRKAIETFEKLYLDFQKGDVTAQELQAACKLAFSLLSGLCSNAVTTMTSMIEAELRDSHAKELKRQEIYLGKAGNGCIVEICDDGLNLIQFKVNNAKTIDAESDKLHDKLVALRKMLKERGFERV